MRGHTARTTSCVIQVGNSFLCASLLSKERERETEKRSVRRWVRGCVCNVGCLPRTCATNSSGLVCSDGVKCPRLAADSAAPSQAQFRWTDLQRGKAVSHLSKKASFLTRTILVRKFIRFWFGCCYSICWQEEMYWIFSGLSFKNKVSEQIPVVYKPATG